MSMLASVRPTANRHARRRPLRSPLATSSQTTKNTHPDVREASVSSRPTVRGPPYDDRELASAASAETTKVPETSNRYSWRLSDLALRLMRRPTSLGPRASPTTMIILYFIADV